MSSDRRSPIEAAAKKILLRLKRFSESLINITLVSLAVLAFCQPTRKQEFTIRSRIAGKIIFEAKITEDSWFQIPMWQGETLYKTQGWVFVQYKNLQNYQQKPLDMWGWVWYYDDGRKLTNVLRAPTETRNVSTWKQTER